MWKWDGIGMFCTQLYLSASYFAASQYFIFPNMENVTPCGVSDGYLCFRCNQWVSFFFQGPETFGVRLNQYMYNFGLVHFGMSSKHIGEGSAFSYRLQQFVLLNVLYLVYGLKLKSVDLPRITVLSLGGKDSVTSNLFTL